MTSPQIAKFVSQIFYPTVISFILINLKLDKRKCPTLSGMVMNIQGLICIVLRDLNSKLSWCAGTSITIFEKIYPHRFIRYLKGRLKHLEN